MSNKSRLLMGLAAAVAVAGVGFLASQALASGPTGVRFEAVEPPAAQLSPVIAPDVTRLGVRDVLDMTGYRAASDFARRVTPYVHLDGSGVPRLDAGVSADELGVTSEFMADFESALGFAAQAIRQGRVVVREDLTVETVGPISAAPAMALDSAAPFPDSAGPGDASLDWQSWRYNSGAMFYNSHEDYWSYFYNRYYVLCSSMAAQIGYPWMSTNLVYFYAYNGWSFSRYCGSGSGMYWFMPYSSSGCYQYNPCYCCGVSYRPIYIWVMTYQYVPSCRCQQQVWGWQGYWARY